MTGLVKSTLHPLAPERLGGERQAASRKGHDKGFGEALRSTRGARHDAAIATEVKGPGSARTEGTLRWTEIGNKLDAVMSRASFAAPQAERGADAETPPAPSSALLENAQVSAQGAERAPIATPAASLPVTVSAEPLEHVVALAVEDAALPGIPAETMPSPEPPLRVWPSHWQREGAAEPRPTPPKTDSAPAVVKTPTPVAAHPDKPVTIAPSHDARPHAPAAGPPEKRRSIKEAVAASETHTSQRPARHHDVAPQPTTRDQSPLPGLTEPDTRQAPFDGSPVTTPVSGELAEERRGENALPSDLPSLATPETSERLAPPEPNPVSPSTTETRPAVGPRGDEVLASETNSPDRIVARLPDQKGMSAGRKDVSATTETVFIPAVAAEPPRADRRAEASTFADETDLRADRADDPDAMDVAAAGISAPQPVILPPLPPATRALPEGSTKAADYPATAEKEVDATAPKQSFTRMRAVDQGASPTVQPAPRETPAVSVPPARSDAAFRTLQAPPVPASADTEPVDTSNVAQRVTIVATQNVPAPPAPPSLQVAAALSADSAWISAATRAAAHDVQARIGASATQSLKVQLHPAELGVVTASLRFAGSQLSIELQVETLEAHRRLSADSETIVKSLRSLGFDIDRVTIAQPAIANTQPSRPDAGAQASGQTPRGGDFPGSGTAGGSGSNGQQRDGGGGNARQDRQHPAAGQGNRADGGGLYI